MPTTPVHPISNASIRPVYQGMASRRDNRKSRRTSAGLDFSPQPTPPDSSARQPSVLRTPRLRGIESSHRQVAMGGTSVRNEQQRQPQLPDVSGPSILQSPRAKRMGAKSARNGMLPMRFESRDWDSKISPKKQWNNVRGTRQVLTRGKEATDTELTRALQQITATLAAQVGSGPSNCTCWVGSIPAECADQDTIARALKPFGAVRSVAVRVKPGAKKSWALAVFESADAAERARTSKVAVEDANGVPCKLIVCASNLNSELQKTDSSALMHMARVSKMEVNATAAETELATEAVGPSGTPELHGATRPPSYKTMMLMRASVLNKLGKNGQAIEDLETLVEEQLSDSTAYRILAKTQRAHTLNQAGGWSASDQPGPIVPSAHSLCKATARRPTDAKLIGEYRESIGDVQRERPFWMPTSRRKKLEGLEDVPLEGAVGQRNLRKPWHYDLVIERVAELALTRAQLLDVRGLLRRNVPMLLSTFRYYCQLGPTAKNQKFAQVRPSRSNINESNDVALGATGRIFGEAKVEYVKADDMDEMLVGRPFEAISLWQFRQMLLDCKVITTECRMADCGRLFALCSRPFKSPVLPQINSPRGAAKSRITRNDEDDSHIRWSEAGIDPDPSAEDTNEAEANVHDPRRRLHVYGFLECLVRLSVTKYGLPWPALAGDGKTRAAMSSRMERMRSTGAYVIATQFQQLLTDCVLPYSCSHENNTAIRWDALLAETEALVRGARAQLDKIFSFFSTATSSGGSNAAENGFIAHGSSHELYEKYRDARPKLTDDTMSFNQLCSMLEQAGLLTASLPPRQLAGLWEDVTGYASTQPGIDKANLRAEMTRGEFVEFLLAVRRKVAPAVTLNSPGAIEEWFLNDLLPSINGAMPLRGDALAKSMDQSSTHYLSTGTANLNAAKKRLSQVPLFSEVADEKFVDVVGAALEPRTISPDAPIITTGEVGSEMYFLVEGEVDVLVRETHVATLGPGSWFGEMALLSNELRNADVIASSGSHAELFALSKTALEQAVQQYPRLVYKLEQEMSARRIARQKFDKAEKAEEESEGEIDGD